MNLKNRLIALRDKPDSELTGHATPELIDSMLAALGDPDPELRDDLIYRTFSRFILSGALTADTERELLETSISDDFLFYKIGEKGSVSVFRRSFSSLLAALLLYHDKQPAALPLDVIHTAGEKSVSYLMQEEDRRGYDEEHGWAHAIAHGADLLDEAVSHPRMGGRPELFGRSLEAIANCVRRTDGVYTDDEDERLIIPIENMIPLGLEECTLISWVEELAEIGTGRDLPFFRQRTNVMSFLKSLYFRLSYSSVFPDCRKTILTKTQELHEEIYGG